MTSILLQRNGSLSSLEVIESLNDELLTASVSSAVNAFSDAITMYVEPRALLSSCIDCLLPCMEKEAPEPHQLAASIFLGSALMNGYQGEASMQVASVVSALLKGTGSESEGVRWNAYSSLEGVLVVNSASVSGLIPQLVSTLGNALCGDELPHITAAAAQLLTSILHRRADYEYQLPEGMLYTFLSFAQQILERPEATLREHAAGLVEILSKQNVCIRSKACRLLPGILLHIRDEEEAVCASCAAALKALAEHLPTGGVEGMESTWRECDSMSTSPDERGVLYQRISQLLISKDLDEESPAAQVLDSCMRMLTSMAVQTRSNAACFGLTLLAQMTPEQKEVCCVNGFMQDVLEIMKDDEDPYARAEVALTLGTVGGGL
eukprot:TRINITY_DN2222_c0_g1_i14.p1 TRINITY_DN2222_c0_g1~~TRINITY_DN2222_c0_g1_i14.p1  ORF type:complete len:379 (+),score=99.20 TRINITY_DN2222_c0_g1_i14:247-1383(+)